MSKKDFEKIAAVLKRIIEQIGRVDLETENGNVIEDLPEFLIDEFVWTLEDDPRFDGEKFRKFIYKDNKYYSGEVNN